MASASDTSGSEDTFKVIVRCRPFTAQEKEQGLDKRPCIEMVRIKQLLATLLFMTLSQVGNETLLKSVAQARMTFFPETNPPNTINIPSQKGTKSTTLRFAFDASYSSMEGARPLATQAMLFDNVGRFALDNALKGEFTRDMAPANSFQPSPLPIPQASRDTPCARRLQRQHVRLRPNRHGQNAQHDRPP